MYPAVLYLLVYEVVRGTEDKLKDHILFCHTVIDITKLSDSQMKMLHPFHTNDLNQLRTCDPINPVDHVKFHKMRTLWIKRLDLFCKAQVDRLTKPCCVYLVATIGKKFTSAVAAFDYVMKGADDVAFYLGCSGKGIEVDRHHFVDPDNSCLGQAGQRGETVVVLKLWEFKGTAHQANLKSAHELEARLIEFALTGQDYTAKNGARLRWLNVKREAATFLTLPIEQQENAISDGITGIPFLCRNATCDGKCGSFLHLQKKECKILPFPVPAQSNIQPPPKLPPQKPPLTDLKEIRNEVTRRLIQIQTSVKYNIRPACVYVSILPLTQEIGEMSAVQYCHHLDTTPEVYETTKGYIGKNEWNGGMFKGHTRTPHLTTPGKVLMSGKRKCMQVGSIPRVNVDEAEKLEARMLVHLFLQARTRREGRKIDPLNKNLSCAAWLRCSLEEKEESVGIGLAGVSPIIFGAEDPVLRMKGINYPIIMNVSEVKEVALPEEDEEES